MVQVECQAGSIETLAASPGPLRQSFFDDIAADPDWRGPANDRKSRRGERSRRQNRSVAEHREWGFGMKKRPRSIRGPCCAVDHTKGKPASLGWTAEILAASQALETSAAAGL